MSTGSGASLIAMERSALPGAGGEMVVDEPACLHRRVDARRAEEAEREMEAVEAHPAHPPTLGLAGADLVDDRADRQAGRLAQGNGDEEARLFVQAREPGVPAALACSPTQIARSSTRT